MLRLLLLQLALPLLSQAAELSGKVEGPLGTPVPDANIYLFRPAQNKASYQSTSDKAGHFRVDGIAQGVYLLQITARSLGHVQRIHITNAKMDLGTIRLRTNDCKKPGVFCDDFSQLAAKVHLSCADVTRLLRDDDGSTTLIQTEELERRALNAPWPKWPDGKPPSTSVTVYVIIGESGTVLCAAVENLSNPWDSAAIEAASRWVFQPVLQHGQPISVLGKLVFSHDDSNIGKD